MSVLQAVEELRTKGNAMSLSRLVDKAVEYHSARASGSSHGVGASSAGKPILFGKQALLSPTTGGRARMSGSAAAALAALEHVDPLVVEFLGEILSEYARANNKMALDCALRDPEQSGLFGSIVVPDQRAVIPTYGSYVVPGFQYEAVYRSFTFYSVLTKDEVINALIRVRSEWSDGSGHAAVHCEADQSGAAG